MVRRSLSVRPDFSNALQALEQRTLLATGPAVITGPMEQYHPITIQFTGPTASEMDNSPNPFKDYRLQLNLISPSGKTHSIPGYFDGDGRGGATGNIWRAKLTPAEAGQWKYTASFRRGTNIAIDLSSTAGTATSFNGATGTFGIDGPSSTAATMQGFFGKGMLQYASGQHYLKFQDGTYYVKAGSNEPENFLGFTGFDSTPNGWHKYAAHVNDWKTGDPDWNSGKGKPIIGLVNYFAQKGINSIYLLAQNVGGQNKDVWPWAGNINRYGGNDNTHYDVSKLAQWTTVFEHMNKKGIVVNMVFAETEEASKKELDNATLGTERKLFYREMAARFGYLPGLEWNLNEEYCWRYPISDSMIKSWAGYMRSVDPFDRPMTVHSQGYQQRTWGYFVGDNRFDLTSLQYYKSVANYGKEIEYWRNTTSSSGRAIAVSIDEARETTASNQTAQRKELLWSTLLSGGNLEWSTDKFGWCDDFRYYDGIYTTTGYALKFMKNIPFWQMKPSDSLVEGESSSYGGGQCFAKAGDTYAIYLPNASSSSDTLNLTGQSGSYTLKWFNPRTGNFEGSSRTISAGSRANLGTPPSSSSEDWVILVKKGTTAARGATSPTSDSLFSNTTFDAGNLVDDVELL